MESRASLAPVVLMQTELNMDVISNWHRVIIKNDKQSEFLQWAKTKPDMVWSGWFIPNGNMNFIGIYIRDPSDAVLTKLSWHDH